MGKHILDTTTNELYDPETSTLYSILSVSSIWVRACGAAWA